MRNREGGSDQLKIGLKYCGGCRAGYDRVGLAGSIEESLAGKVEWAAVAGETVEEILIICGCKTACTHMEGVRCPVRRISSPQEAGPWIAEMNRRIP